MGLAQSDKPKFEPPNIYEVTHSMNDTNNKTPRPAVSDKAKTLGLILPVLLLCVGFLAGLCWFLRPATSETEKRELTEFPAFTVESFLSGEFTDQVSLWYADTFPGREGFIKAYHGIQSLFGLRDEQFQQGDMGDDIPDGPMNPNAPVDRPTNGGEGARRWEASIWWGIPPTSSTPSTPRERRPTPPS